MASFAQFEERIRRRIHELEIAGLQRRLQPPSGIDLSSNDYLGLATHPLLKQKMADAVLEGGCGSTGSRLLRGERASFAAVERRFAAFKKAEASLYFSSGYTANIGVLGTFLERHDVVLTDSENHASIVDGIRLSRAKRVKFRHCDTDDLARKLRALSGGPSETQVFLVTESLFSMDGDFAPLADYAQLCRETGTVLIVDEAHAVGVYGGTGSGWIEHTGTWSEVLVSIDTAGKALGVSGAFVSGPEWAVDYLIQRARPFMFSTAPPPALAAALDASLTVIEQEPERRRRVKELSVFLRRLLVERGADPGRSQSQIIPLIIGETARAKFVAAELQREGFDVRAIRPPAVPWGTSRLRVSVNALLDEGTLQRFASHPSEGDNMLRGLFVTGTDTGVGKTAVAAALMLRYRELGTLKYWKPIQTGIEEDDDTATVQSLGCLESEVFTPGVRLHRPVAPYLAAELSGMRITLPDLEACIAEESENARWVAEGAGGALVPLNDSQFMIDLMVQLGMPVLVVARSSLGTINHTLMTLEVLRNRTLNVAGVVMVGEPNESNCDAIQRFGEVEVVGEMPVFSELTPDVLAGWARTGFDTKGYLASCFS